ncbi:MAG: winged helix-turn-helix transcriptional regulator [Verrucomicrobia bacterium]|nr:winged helix-turn-helix transcriptional regulator [Verrucomicrobiota bacterium]
MSKKLSPSELSDQAIELIAARFKVLSEPSRLKLLIALEEGEKNVSQLVTATGATQATTSRHLQALADAGLVQRRREGAAVFYSIADAAVFGLCEHVCGSVQKRLQQQAQAAKLFGG